MFFTVSNTTVPLSGYLLTLRISLDWVCRVRTLLEHFLEDLLARTWLEQYPVNSELQQRFSSHWQFQIFNALLFFQVVILTPNSNLGSTSLPLIIDLLFTKTQLFLLLGIKSTIALYCCKNWGFLVPELTKQLSTYFNLIDLNANRVTHILSDSEAQMRQCSLDVQLKLRSWFVTAMAALCEIKFSCTYFCHKWSGLNALCGFHNFTNTHIQSVSIGSKIWTGFPFFPPSVQWPESASASPSGTEAAYSRIWKSGLCKRTRC